MIAKFKSNFCLVEGIMVATIILGGVKNEYKRSGKDNR
ncbi:hypothetical protein NT05LI_0767, partial [Listeria ivanovii FSL F6-596]